MGRVWVVGSLNVDRPWLVERHPRVGETVVGEALDPVPGGKGLNQAVAAARMGAEVVLVGSVGDDDDGRWLISVAEHEGIDVSRVAASGRLSTGTALIVVAADGANTVTVAAGSNRDLVVHDLPVAPGDVVVAQLEVPEAAVAAAFGAARRVGATRLLNPSPLPDGEALADRADVLVLNEDEAIQLAGHGLGGAEEAARALASTDRTVVVTLGERGVLAAGPAGVLSAAGLDLGSLGLSTVDTTGAGDCFLGVLAAGLAAGAELGDALGLANRAAAIQVTRRGTVDAMPTADEVGRAAKGRTGAG